MGDNIDNSTLDPPVIDKATILYVIPFRGKNLYRKKNIKIVLEWITKAKDHLRDNYDVNLDVLIVEQDKEPFDWFAKNNISPLFLTNNGLFNKGWGFNVAVKKNPSYQYYGFGDGDIIVPDIEVFCDQIIEHTCISPKKAFRPFKDRLDTSMSDHSTINSFDNLSDNFNSIKNRLTVHGGLSFASNMIFMSRQTFETIGGWDEAFRGWGRYDDFITHKLNFICQCNAIYATVPAVHLFHPIAIEFSLNPDNVHLYDKYIKYSKNDLLKMVESNSKTIGDPNFYKVNNINNN